MDLAIQVNHCQKCAKLQAKLVKPPIFYVGENYQGILIVGESPHKNWLNASDPFLNASASSKRIIEYLAMIGKSQGEIALAEVTKCLVEDRKNLIPMMKNCQPYLLEQFRELKPMIIVSIGQKTAEALSVLYDVPVTMLQQTKLGEAEYWPLYHPSPINPKNHARNVEFLRKQAN